MRDDLLDKLAFHTADHRSPGALTAAKRRTKRTNSLDGSGTWVVFSGMR